MIQYLSNATDKATYQRVLSSLAEISHKIPSELFEEINTEMLAYKLMLISNDVKRSEARFISLIPSSYNIDVINNPCHTGSRLLAYGEENKINQSLSKLNELLTRSVGSIKLTIDQSDFALPNDLAHDTITAVISKLTVANRASAKSSAKNCDKLKLKILVDYAYRRISDDLLVDSQVSLNRQQKHLLTAVVLVGAGIFPSVEEYEVEKKVKGNYNVIDRVLLESTGGKKKLNKTRYFKYYEILLREIKEINPRERISIDGLISKLITPSSAYSNKFKHT